MISTHTLYHVVSINALSKDSELRVRALVMMQMVRLLRIRSCERVVEGAALSDVSLNEQWLLCGCTARCLRPFHLQLLLLHEGLFRLVIVTFEEAVEATRVGQRRPFVITGIHLVI